MNPGHIACDNYETCGSVAQWRGSTQATYQSARVKGWHIFQGSTMGGAQLTAVICDKCIGTNRSRLEPAPKVLPGQLELPLNEGHSNAPEDSSSS